MARKRRYTPRKSSKEMLNILFGLLLIGISIYLLFPFIVQLIKVVAALFLFILGMYFLLNKPRKYHFWKSH